MFEEMRNRGFEEPMKLFAITAPTVGVASLNQENQLKEDIEAAGDIELIKHDLDLANAVQDTLNTSRQTLERNPDLAGMWTLCDFCLPLMAQTVKSKQPDERKTVVAGMFSNPETIANIRNGEADAVADYAWDLPVWVGMDQALQNWTRDQEIEKTFDVFDSYPLEFMEPYVITKENAGESGPAPIYGPDYRTFFKTKWAAEFGVDAG
jgi:ABC-type sugar transport system substrate-binding protein